MQRFTVLFALLLGGLLVPATAMAADTPARTVPAQPSILDPGWIVTLQFGPGVAPSYPGDNKYRVSGVPGIGVRRGDEPERFAAPDDGFGVPIIDVAGFRAGPVGNLIPPRYHNHSELTGLRRPQTAIEIGGFAEYYPLEFMRGRVELRQGVLGHHGLVATIAADGIQKFGQFTATLGPRLNFGTHKFTSAYFSVYPAEALVNGRVTPFRAEGGMTSAGMLGTLRYDFTPAWNATAYGGLQRLTGSAGASPVPNLLGSRNQFSAGLLVARSFKIEGF